MRKTKQPITIQISPAKTFYFLELTTLKRLCRIYPVPFNEKILFTHLKLKGSQH